MACRPNWRAFRDHRQTHWRRRQSRARKTRRRRAGELPPARTANIEEPCQRGSKRGRVTRAQKNIEGNIFVAVKLRLVRMGKKKQPTYRLVAADSRSPRNGRFLEILGTYEPRGISKAEPETVIHIDNDKAVKWLSQGAQPTERVAVLLKSSGAWDQFTEQKAK